jgi:hypothetical protein
MRISLEQQIAGLNQGKAQKKGIAPINKLIGRHRNT